MLIKRAILKTVISRLLESRHFIQVLEGPRQVGKTTLAHQAAKAAELPTHYASADEPGPKDLVWVKQQWDVARLLTHNNVPSLLILDEVQKIPQWSTMIKQLWDEDTHANCPLKVMLLGSAPLLIQHGLSESLAGRFEIIPITHWLYAEMHEAFGWNVSQYMYFGGYPGAASLINDEVRWRRYILDSLIETTLARDIISLVPVHKPALLRQLFYVGSCYSGQILSYQKMLGQLQDAGNTTTLAHYLDLLTGAGLLTGIGKFAGHIVRQRGSSPKFQVLNTALMSAQQTYSFVEAQETPDYWGRLVESAVGAYLLNSIIRTDMQLYYWRHKNQEVDFILQKGDRLIALEIKSGIRKEALSGMAEFDKLFKPKHVYLIGGHGMPLEEFLQRKIEDLF